MLIVDAQIHLWEKGTPSAHHRQEPSSAEQAIAGMDAAGVARALLHQPYRRHPPHLRPDTASAGFRHRAPRDDQAFARGVSDKARQDADF